MPNATTVAAPGARYTNVKNGSVIEIVEADDFGRCVVATVNGTGRLINQRKLGARNLHDNYLNLAGAPWKTGYVLTSALPYTHPYAPRAVVKEVFSVDVEDMSDEALAAYVYSKEAEAKAIAKDAEDAKDELKKRTKQAGLRLFGEVAVTARRTRRFNAGLAKKMLKPEVYQAICSTKPDPEKAKRLLGEDSADYDASCKKYDWTVTVRTATDEDREAAEMAELTSREEPFKPGSVLAQEATAPF